MQRNQIITMEETNLLSYPHPYPEFKADPKNQVTIGDLHANPLKLLHFLIFQNVLDMSEDDYNLMKQIYLSNKHSITEFNKFSEILARAKVLPVGMVRLIGDEVADRGKNDFFILKILEKLGKNNVPVEILFSNHGVEFYSELTTQRNIVLTKFNNQRNSLNILLQLMKDDVIDEKEVKELAEKFYFPCLKAVSYSIDETTNSPIVTLYSHAPVGLETLRSLAKLYKVNYQDNSIDALCDTIDQINDKFRKSNPAVLMQQEYPALIKRDCYSRGSIPIDYPLSRISWNRRSEDIKLPHQQNGYALRLVHGHVGIQVPMKSANSNITNLDSSTLGKISYCPQSRGLYYSLYSQDKISLKKTEFEQKSENEKTLKPVDLDIPVLEWNTKNSLALKAKTKQAISSLMKHVAVCETTRRLPWCSWFRDADSSGAEKMAKQLEKAHGESFNKDELIALRMQPLKQITDELEKDCLLPAQFVYDEQQQPRRNIC